MQKTNGRFCNKKSNKIVPSIGTYVAVMKDAEPSPVTTNALYVAMFKFGTSLTHPH